MNKVTVILVDDDINQKLIIGKYIKIIHSDIKFVAFTEAQLALDYLKNTDFGNTNAVILLDIFMPYMNGWDFLDEYKHFSKKFDVILFSSSIADLDIQKSKEYSEVKQFVVKPIDKDHLAKVLEVYIDDLNYV